MAIEIRRRPPSPSLDFAAGLHPVLSRVYAARGIAHADDLDMSLERLLPVRTLDGVERAADLLIAHRAGRVLVVGDFDADGATGSALLVRGLRALKFAHVDFLVPNRFQFGYGLTPGIVALAAARAPSLIVTVDNGVSSIEGVEAARAHGIPVLITDHHLPGASLPCAEAIVNPNLGDSTFASRALSGVGVAFYVVAALARALGDTGFRPSELLDLVALGTVADLVPLDRNNRVLVAQGLRRIRAGRCVPGIRALIESAGRSLDRMSAADLGFARGAAPERCRTAHRHERRDRLPARGRARAGRGARRAAHAAQRGAARDRAAHAARGDRSRRRACASMRRAARRSGVCLFDEGWHQGVVGLVAGRIKDRLHRPVIAFARGGGRIAAGLGALGGGNSYTRRARRHRDPPSGTDREVRRSCDGGGHELAAKPIWRAFRAAFAAEIAARALGDDAHRRHSQRWRAARPMRCARATARAARRPGPGGRVSPSRFSTADSSSPMRASSAASI